MGTLMTIALGIVYAACLPLIIFFLAVSIGSAADTMAKRISVHIEHAERGAFITRRHV